MKKALSVTAIFALVLWGCTVLSGFIHAQPVKRLDVPVQLDDNALEQMLNNMGLEPKKLSKGYVVAIKQDTWTLNIQVVLSPDGRKVGLNSNLGTVDDPASISASQWMNLLISNGDIDPSAFYFNKDQKKLYLHRSFDNRGINPAVLRKEIDNFGANIRGTEALWKFTK